VFLKIGDNVLFVDEDYDLLLRNLLRDSLIAHREVDIQVMMPLRKRSVQFSKRFLLFLI
jgi:hypothetical protein